MYLEHYGLKEAPFSITPDPRFVFLSERHRDALAHLLFGIGQGGGGGFVQLTGEVGTGKTTLSRLLLEQIPENTRVALVLNPRLSPEELLETICEELHLPVDGRRGSIKGLTDALNAYLLEAYAHGLRVVLIIDEAQNLSAQALEQVRLLTNLETATQKLLQIILLGQPELRDLLARPDLRQLAQRITARYHLTPLDDVETASYLRHRYRVAGGQHLPFDAAAIARIHRHSGGVPRLINVIAERALLGGYAHDETRINARTVDRAARETLAPTRAADHARWKLPVLLAAGLAGVAAVALLAGGFGRVADSSAAPTPVSASGPAIDKPAAPASSRAAPLDSDALADAIADAAAQPNAAWGRLLALWSRPAGEAQSQAAAECRVAQDPGFYSVRGLARLDRLVALERPVLLRLGDSASAAWAVLQAADARRVRLWLGGRVVDIDRLALARHWNGEYAALWQGPAGLDVPLAADGPGMAWLRRELAPHYLAPDAARDDATLQAAVRRLQADRGLATDGVPGPETLMALAADDPGGPRLDPTLE